MYATHKLTKPDGDRASSFVLALLIVGLIASFALWLTHYRPPGEEVVRIEPLELSSDSPESLEQAPELVADQQGFDNAGEIIRSKIPATILDSGPVDFELTPDNVRKGQLAARVEKDNPGTKVHNIEVSSPGTTHIVSRVTRVRGDADARYDQWLRKRRSIRQGHGSPFSVYRRPLYDRRVYKDKNDWVDDVIAHWENEYEPESIFPLIKAGRLQVNEYELPRYERWKNENH